jgi:hypothetical protein
MQSQAIARRALLAEGSRGSGRIYNRQREAHDGADGGGRHRGGSIERVLETIPRRGDMALASRGKEGVDKHKRKEQLGVCMFGLGRASKWQ